jgi:short-subunit dehydrogenase
MPRHKETSPFSGKRALVTGGSSGIGKQIAFDLLKAGAEVTIVAHDLSRLMAATNELSGISPAVRWICCDVSRIDDVQACADQYAREQGNPDILINNAGYAVYQAFEEMSAAEIARLINVNFVGACLVTRAFLPSMIRAGGGDVCMMASIAGRIPMTPCGVYSAAKHGMVAWAQTLRAEVRRHKVRVTVLCPGRVETEFFSHPTFQARAFRKETEWTIPVETVSAACLDAIASGRFLTYVPRSYVLPAWAFNACPALLRPLLERVMSSRVDAIRSAGNLAGARKS